MLIVMWSANSEMSAQTTASGTENRMLSGWRKLSNCPASTRKMNTSATMNRKLRPPLDSTYSRESPARSVRTPGGSTRFAIALRSVSALPMVTPGTRLPESVAERTRLK